MPEDGEADPRDFSFVATRGRARLRRGTLAASLGLALVVATTTTASAAPATTPAPSTPTTVAASTSTGGAITPGSAPAVLAKSWMVVDGATGQVLGGKDVHTARLTASTVKVMTALTALRLIGPNAKVTVSALAAGRTAMRLGIPPGQVWPMRDLMASMLVVSANDAAYALAEGAAGSVDSFAKAMTDTGRRLGLQDSTFLDPAGLDGRDSAIGASMMSAYDLAVLGRAALADPVIGPMVGSKVIDLVGPDGAAHHLVNHNRLLGSYSGALGVKTGFTSAAGGTFITAAKRGDRTIVVAIAGAGGSVLVAGSALLDWAFTQPVPAAGTTTTEVLPPATQIAQMPAPAGITPVAVDDSGSGDGNRSAGAEAPAGAGSTHLTATTSGGSPLPVPVVALLLVALAGAGAVVLRRRSMRQRAALTRYDHVLGGLLLLESPRR